MIKKIFRIFSKETKVALRDGMMIIILVMPVLLAFGIKLFTPSITDASIKIALLETDTIEHIDYLEQYVQVELFKDLEALEKRINKNDDIIGYLKTQNGYQIVIEGNEIEGLIDYAKLLNVYYANGASEATSTAEILSLQKEDSPLVAVLTNMLILMIVMLAGMVISLSIVEEKKDKTISAINVSPVSQTSFIIGKVLLGGISSLVSIILSLLILGYADINWLMLILVGVSSMFLTFIIGFLQGLISEDVIEAASGVKLVMIPMAGSIAGYMLLSSKWQWTMYWSPFYWTYKANDLILAQTGDWKTILLSVAAVIVLTALVYLITFPKIRKGLS